MCREKSLRNGVHHANAVVWGPVYRTRLTRSRRRIPRIRRRPVDGLVVVRRRSATPARRRRARAAPSRARRSSASVWSAGALPPRGARRPRTTPNDGPRLPRRRRRLRSRAAWCSGRARRRRGRARTRRAAARRRARGPDRRSVCRFLGGGGGGGGGRGGVRGEARRGRSIRSREFIHSTLVADDDDERRRGARGRTPVVAVRDRGGARVVVRGARHRARARERRRGRRPASVGNASERVAALCISRKNFSTRSDRQTAPQMRRARELVAYAVALELGALAAAYAAFHKLNTDASSRAWAASNCPVVLRGFASAVEACGYSLPPDLRAFVDEKDKTTTTTTRREGGGGGG